MNAQPGNPRVQPRGTTIANSRSVILADGTRKQVTIFEAHRMEETGVPFCYECKVYIDGKPRTMTVPVNQD